MHLIPSHLLLNKWHLIFLIGLGKEEDMGLAREHKPNAEQQWVRFNEFLH